MVQVLRSSELANRIVAVLTEIDGLPNVIQMGHLVEDGIGLVCLCHLVLWGESSVKKEGQTTIREIATWVYATTLSTHRPRKSVQ